MSSPKNKHHFVPRFYLGAFQSAPRRINVLGVNFSREIQNASLRDQCYRRKFYGNSDTIEDALGLMESHAARVLKAIQSTEMLFAEGSEEHGTLLAFVAFQLLRTAVAAARVNTVIDKTTKQVHSHDQRISSEELESAQFGFDDPVLFAVPVENAIGAAWRPFADSSALTVQGDERVGGVRQPADSGYWNTTARLRRRHR